jgi:hypothetical protein
MIKCLRIKIIIVNFFPKPHSSAPVAHTCNPSYLGGWDQEDWGLRQAWINGFWDYLNQNRMDWRCGLLCRHEALMPWVQTLALLKTKLNLYSYNNLCFGFLDQIFVFLFINGVLKTIIFTYTLFYVNIIFMNIIHIWVFETITKSLTQKVTSICVFCWFVVQVFPFKMFNKLVGKCYSVLPIGCLH